MGTIQIDGSTPKLTIGNATAEDATILFDGNAQDFYIALDDSADDLLIGLGSTVGTTPIITIDENKLSTFSGAITVGVDDTGHDVKFFGATASAYMLWDESADDLILAGAAGLSVAGATATAALTASGIIKTDDTTEATSTTDGSLQTDGGLSVVKDAVFGDDVSLLSDAAVLNFGADKDVSVTHVADAGLKISSAQSSDKELLTLESTQAGANGPFIKFNHDTSSPADDDIAGGLDFYNDDDGGNSTQVGKIEVKMTDVSNGSENSIITFSNNVAGTFGEAMRVHETGNLCVGTTGNTAKLNVIHAVDQRTALFENTNASCDSTAFEIKSARDTSAEYNLLLIATGSGTEFRVQDDGNAFNTNNSYGALSDNRIKQNVEDASSQWNDIKALKIRKYKLKKLVNRDGVDNTPYHLGVIAQELEASSMSGLIEERKPEEKDVALSSDFGSIDGDGKFTEGQKVKEVKYSILYMKAIKALQEAQTRIETLETKVAALEG
jgi:hypothetical protein